MPGEVLAQGLDQGAVLAVDGTDPAEPEVVLPDFFQAFLRDAAPARDVLQERDHVVRAFGATEGEQEQGVVRGGIERVWHVSILPPGTDTPATAGWRAEISMVYDEILHR